MLERVAQILLVIEVDGGDDRGERGDDVGGIKPTAQTGFPQNNVHLLPRKMLEGHHGDHFKKSRQPICGKISHERLQTFHQPYHLRLTDRLAVDLNAFAKAQEVRRGEQASLHSRLAADAFEHGAHGSFAVGAGHVSEAQALMRIAGVGGEGARIFQVQLGPQ